MTPAGQRWTREKPTEAGWYWFRFGDGWSHYVFCVYQMRGQLMVDLPGGVEKSLFLMEDGEWQGPLTPNEATDV